MSDAVPAAGVPVSVRDAWRTFRSGGVEVHAVHGVTLDVARSADGVITDLQTGSTWHPDGLALEGDLAGVQLAFVTSFFTEWYGWAAFHPDTLIYGG